MERPVTFESDSGQIVGMLHLPEVSRQVAGVVLCHGFTGTKAEAHFIFVKLARRLAADGMAVLRFDFRGSGDSEGAFERMTISTEVADAHRAVEFLAAAPEVDRKRIGVVGLSLGGCVAALVGGASSLVRATVLWAPVVSPKRQFARLAEPGITYPFEFVPGMMIGRAAVEELDRIDPVEALTHATGPVLVLHGSDDQTIPCAASEVYAAALAKAGVPCEREVIAGADHTFSGVRNEGIVIDRTANWLLQRLDATPATPPRPATYAAAGVDIEAGMRTKSRLKELVRATYTSRVLTELGSFGGLFDGEFPGIDHPVLVASTDGVGTKLKVAILADRHDTVGGDLVNHCVNDILVMGARPLFVMDYISLGRHSEAVVTDLVAGMARACADAGCALLGGETAEMPDVYRPGEYDLAATIVGVVARDRILRGDRVSVGDAVLGLASDGLHTNGYSLARRLCFEEAGWTVETRVPEWGETVGDALLRPHRSYLGPLLPLLDSGRVHALAHITGGGITDNLPRVLPQGTAARIDLSAWPVPPLFQKLVALGRMETGEAMRTFNMGVGMAVVVAAADADSVANELERSGETIWRIGEVIAGDGRVHYDG